MASGLVPVTNGVPAVEEFVDQGCGVLAPVDDADGLAKGILEMVDDPDLFLRRSAAAADRIRRQSGTDLIIPQELALLRSGAYA